MKCKYCGLEIEMKNPREEWSLTETAYRSTEGVWYFTCIKSPNLPSNREHQPLPESERVALILSRYE